MTTNTTVDVSRMVRFDIPEDPLNRSRMQEKMWQTWKDKRTGPIEGMCRICGALLPGDTKIPLPGGSALWPGCCDDCQEVVDEHYESGNEPRKPTSWETECPALFKEILTNARRQDWAMASSPFVKITEWNPNGKGLYIIGDSGHYKTSAIWALYRNLEIRDGIVPKLVTSPILARNLSLSAREIDDKYIKELATCPVLIIDDLGKEKFTETITSGFYEIIDGRYHNRLPIVITSRYGGDALQKRFEVSQDSNMGFDICRRIGDMVERVEV